MADQSTIYRQLVGLSKVLADYVETDPEHEVQGVAIATLDAVIREAVEFVGPGDLVIAEIADVISPETVAEGEPIRVANLLIVVTVLRDRIGRPSIGPVLVE
jgi:hypothetical protein